MTIYQLKNGYHYNSDTLVLYDFISCFLPKNKSLNTLDVGSGSGILGLLLKRDFDNIELNLLDVLDLNLRLCKKNLEQNSIKADMFCLDFKHFKSELRFDLIVSNPPYYHDGVKMSQNEHIATSRYAKNLNLQDFLKVANSHLKPNGEIYFCYECDALPEIFTYLKELKLTCTDIKFIYPRENLKASLVLFRIKKNSKSKSKILPPIYMKKGEKDSKEACEIYKKADLRSEFCEF